MGDDARELSLDGVLDPPLDGVRGVLARQLAEVANSIVTGIFRVTRTMVASLVHHRLISESVTLTPALCIVKLRTGPIGLNAQRLAGLVQSIAHARC